MSALDQKLMGSGLQRVWVLKRTCLWSCLFVKLEGQGMWLSTGDGQIGLCQCGVSRMIRVSGVGSRYGSCVGFHGRSCLGPFVCDIGGGQGGVRTFGGCLSEGDFTLFRGKGC